MVTIEGVSTLGVIVSSGSLLLLEQLVKKMKKMKSE